jgi:hypothetical protein
MTEEFSVSPQSLLHDRQTALAGEYLRAFAAATRRMGDFNDFYEALRQLVHNDSYLEGTARIFESAAASAAVPDFENLDSSETVVSICGSEGSAGYLKYRGRRDGESFASEDLHLMGAIAGCIAVLTAKAQQFREKDESLRVFQYLINQLPLGVICFDAEGGLLVQNKLANCLLGASGSALIRGALSGKTSNGGGRMRMHLEVEGKLLYTEGRRLEVDAGLSITAFVLHDMSSQREMHLLQLERSVYRAESRDTPLTVALLEDRSEAGRLVRLLQASASSLQLDAREILALDAYTCVCVFTDKRLRNVRHLLQHGCPRALDREAVKASLMAQWTHLSEEAPAQALIDGARGRLQPLAGLLRPALLVLDPYPAVFESLEWIGGEIVSFERVNAPGQAADRIESGAFDGIFLDIDSYGDRGLDWLRDASERAGPGFRTFYLSHKQASMVYADYGLPVDATVFQKPFDTEKLRETLALQFDFA